MIWIVLGLTVLFIGCVYFLYILGKDVKKKEAEFQKMFSEQEARNRLKKYKRKSTPKVPTISK